MRVKLDCVDKIIITKAATQESVSIIEKRATAIEGRNVWLLLIFDHIIGIQARTEAIMNGTGTIIWTFCVVSVLFYGIV